MRRAALLSAPLVLVLAGACHRTPEEQAPSLDAGLAAPPPSAAPADAARPAASAASRRDGGASNLVTFCGDVYAADSTRLAGKCMAKDMAFAQGLAKAASTLCVDDMTAAVARARTAFDAEAARSCVALLTEKDLPRASDTDTLFRHFPCDRVLVGLQPAGQPCRFSVECKDGLSCVGYAPSVDGTCAAPPKAGDACTSQRFGSMLSEEAAALHHPSCAPGAWCDGKVCQPQVPAGKPCAANSAICAAGLACVMGKCGKLAPVGGACYATTDCTYGGWCNRPASDATGRCEAKRGGGADCPQADACKGRCEPAKGADGGPSWPGRCADMCGSG